MVIEAANTQRNGVTEMTTITVLNPWTGIQKEESVEDIMISIETFASQEECEAVNNVFNGDNDFDWVKTFEKVHGLDRLSEIAFS